MHEERRRRAVVVGPRRRRAARVRRYREAARVRGNGRDEDVREVYREATAFPDALEPQEKRQCRRRQHVRVVAAEEGQEVQVSRRQGRAPELPPAAARRVIRVGRRVERRLRVHQNGPRVEAELGVAVEVRESQRVRVAEVARQLWPDDGDAHRRARVSGEQRLERDVVDGRKVEHRVRVVRVHGDAPVRESCCIRRCRRVFRRLS